MSRLVHFAGDFLGLVVALAVYFLLPVVIVWGWARWIRRSKTLTITAGLSLAGFALATASGLLGVISVVYASWTGGFPFYDPRLMRIIRWGSLLSLVAFVFSLGGIWRSNSLRWIAPISALGTFFFWFASAIAE
jgi:hypothetical protein